MSTNHLNMIGLAYKAGKCSIGEDKIVKAIQANRVCLVIIATDTGTNTKKKLMDKCHTYGVPFKVTDDRYTLGHSIGKSKGVAIAIQDAGFADRIRAMLSHK